LQYCAAKVVKISDDAKLRIVFVLLKKKNNGWNLQCSSHYFFMI